MTSRRILAESNMTIAHSFGVSNRNLKMGLDCGHSLQNDVLFCRDNI